MVNLPAVSASPGTNVTIPVIVGDLTGQNIVSYDFQVTYDTEILQPLTPAYDTAGTLSSAMLITPNTDNPGHLVISGFQTSALAGAGTLINLKFAVLGSQGQSSALTFEDYTDPGNTIHPAFQFNEGKPANVTTNGNVLVVDGLIKGTITYGNAASPPKFISNVLITGSGSPITTTTTAAPGAGEGQYSLGSFGTGAYTVTPTKTAQTNGISSNDAARVAQHVSGTLAFTNDNQRVSADVSGNGIISSNDAALIARFVAGVGAPIGNTGQWKFYVSNPPFPLPSGTATPFPSSRTYPSVTGTTMGQDYVGLLIGETTGNWNPSGLRPAGTVNGELSGETDDPITVAVQQVVTAGEEKIIVPINVQGAADKSIISYEFDLRYDPTVIQPLENPVDLSETVSRGLTVVANPNEPGLLRVVVYGPIAINENGILLNLRFTAVGAAGSISPLTFERIMFNEGGSTPLVKGGEVKLSF